LSKKFTQLKSNSKPGIKYSWFDVPLKSKRKAGMMSSQITMEQTPLNSLDRCDRCGAQAYVRAILISGGQLLFCSHHAKTYAEGLKPVVAAIQDETQKLAAKN
jgi:hypothetical protein